MTTRTRRFTAVLAVLVLLVLAVGTLFRWRSGERLARAAASFQEEVGSLDLASYRRPTLEPQENAAVWAKAGAAATVLSADDLLRLRDHLDESPDDWDEAARRELRRLLAESEPALELLHRAAGLTASNFDLAYDQGPSMELPNLLDQLKAGRLLLAEARLALLDGDEEAALTALRSLRSQADAQLRESVLIFQLIGLALERFLFDGVQQAVAMGALSPDQLRSVVQRGDSATGVELLRRGLATEGAMTYGVRDSEGWRQANQGISWADRISVYWTGHHYAARALEYYTRCVGQYPSRPYSALLAEELLSPPAAGPGGPAALIVDLRATVGRYKINETLHQLAEASLATWETAAQQGRYPEALPPVLLGSDGQALTGDPLAYRRQDSGAAAEIAADGAWPVARDLLGAGRRGVGERLFTWRLPTVEAPTAAAADG